MFRRAFIRVIFIVILAFSGLFMLVSANQNSSSVNEECAVLNEECEKTEARGEFILWEMLGASIWSTSY